MDAIEEPCQRLEGQNPKAVISLLIDRYFLIIQTSAQGDIGQAVRPRLIVEFAD